jgi:hypothetical protein
MCAAPAWVRGFQELTVAVDALVLDNALRIDKMTHILDAVPPGGDGHP